MSKIREFFAYVALCIVGAWDKVYTYFTTLSHKEELIWVAGLSAVAMLILVWLVTGLTRGKRIEKIEKRVRGEINENYLLIERASLCAEDNEDTCTCADSCSGECCEYSKNEEEDYTEVGKSIAEVIADGKLTTAEDEGDMREIREDIAENEGYEVYFNDEIIMSMKKVDAEDEVDGSLELPTEKEVKDEAPVDSGEISVGYTSNEDIRIVKAPKKTRGVPVLSIEQRTRKHSIELENLTTAQLRGLPLAEKMLNTSTAKKTELLTRIAKLKAIAELKADEVENLRRSDLVVILQTIREEVYAVKKAARYFEIKDSVITTMNKDELVSALKICMEDTDYKKTLGE